MINVLERELVMENKNPLVSVITVSFNAEKTIAKTIESVLKQKYDSFEYIIKDGKSTDNTLKIVQSYDEEFRARDITYKIISEKDSSLYQAMNIAIGSSNGLWINFMNAGDEFYDEGVLSSVFNKEEYGKDIAVIYGDNMIEDEYGTGLNKADMSIIGKKMPFNHQAAFFRESVIKKYMYDEMIKIGADYDLIFKIYEDGYEFKYVNKIISLYKLNGLSSTKYLEVAKDRRDVRHKHGYTDSVLVENAKLLEALLKEFIEKYCPKFVLKYLNRFYKIYVKKYTNVK
jgi:glycosyltransferase involved in cell wall biosynthesis